MALLALTVTSPGPARSTSASLAVQIKSVKVQSAVSIGGVTQPGSAQVQSAKVTPPTQVKLTVGAATSAVKSAKVTSPGTIGLVIVAGGGQGPAGPAGAISLVQNAGAGLTVRNTLNFKGGLAAVDNSGSGRTDIDVGANIPLGTQIITVRASGDTSGVTDKANILAAIALLPAPAGGVIELADPDYYLPNSTGVIWNDRRVTIRGRGAGSSSPGTTIHVLAGGTGLNPQNGASGNGARSRIQGLRILSADVGAGTNNGIRLQCNSGEIVSCDVQGFGGHNIRILSGTAGNPFIVDGQFNANVWLIDHVRSTNSFNSGLMTEGVDSNAGVAVGLDCSNNAGEGVYENCSFGNTYIAPQFQGNTGHAMRCSGNSRSSRFYGIYKDGDSNPAVLIESGNGGGNIFDFRVLLGNAGETIVDNSTAQDSRVISQAGGQLHERFPPSVITGADASWSTTVPAFFLNTGATKTTIVTTAKVVTTNALDQEGIAYPLGTLAAGDYVVGLYVRGNAGGELLEFTAGPAGAGGTRYDAAVTGTTYWTRVSSKFTADGVTACYAVIKTQAGHAAVATFFADALQLSAAV